MSSRVHWTRMPPICRQDCRRRSPCRAWPAVNDRDALAIRTRDLTKRFGELVAVDHVDLDVPARAIYGFLGPNGSGKSNTIPMLCGLLTPSEGRIEVLRLRIPPHAE